jgi:hypothetical protein
MRGMTPTGRSRRAGLTVQVAAAVALVLVATIGSVVHIHPFADGEPHYRAEPPGSHAQGTLHCPASILSHAPFDASLVSVTLAPPRLVAAALVRRPSSGAAGCADELRPTRAPPAVA